jgi:thioredoxin 1
MANRKSSSNGSSGGLKTRESWKCSDAQFGHLQKEEIELADVSKTVSRFLTGWSKPCQLIEPVLDEVAEACNGNAKFFIVNEDDNPDLGTIYSIQSVPTLIYFFNGAVRAKIVGMVSPKAILAKLNSLTLGNPSTKASERVQ